MIVTYEVGDYIVVIQDGNERQFEILESSISKLRLKDVFSGIESTQDIHVVEEMIISGSASIHQKKESTRKLLKPNAIEFEGYSEDLKQEARDRYIFVTSILDMNLPSHSAKRLEHPVSDIWSHGKFEYLTKKPSVRSVQRWLSAYAEGYCSIRALVPLRANKGNRSAKVDKRVESYIKLAIDYFKAAEKPSVASAYDELATRIIFDNTKITDENMKMKVPSKTTLVKRIAKEAPRELMLAREGKEKTRKEYRVAKLPQEISLILQRVEIDHTTLDLFIVDEKTNLILGRPNVTSILDYKSKAVLGFYIGFEKASYLSVARALRHAILPKNYIEKEYPCVVNKYEVYGLPKVIVVDRGKDFESNAFKDACLDLNIRIQRNPARHAWYKGTIESYFDKVNRQLLNDKSGKVFPNILDTNNYDPLKNAVITMGLFMEIFHIWVVDVYHQKKVSRGTIIPRVSWDEDRDKVPLRTVNPTALEIVLAETKKATNNKGGIGFLSIQYDSDDLFDLRAETGFKKVNFKLNREDLGVIHVLDERDPRNKNYIEVPALNQSYAKGLSLHQHNIIRTFHKKYLGEKVDIEGLAKAKMLIKEKVREHILSRKGKISANQSVSRWADIGQQKDNTTKSTVIEDSSDYSGVPKPQAEEPKTISADKASTFDGTNNTLPDELDF